jgi:hypothetical protein
MPMRSTLLVLFFGLVSMSAYAMETPPNDKHCWLILEKKNSEAGPEFVSVIGEIPKKAERQKYSYLFIIKWGYESNSDGLPTEAALIKGRALYKDLDRVFGSNAVFALSRTGGGGRTMYYYASNSSKQGTALKQYFESGPPISIHISVTKQPEWSEVHEVLSQVIEHPGKSAGLTGCSRGRQPATRLAAP